MDTGKMKNSGGFTLVEIMVAMVISLIVLGGVYKAITDETINFTRDEATLDMQNNARAAIASIGLDIRRTGFYGCGGNLSANTVAGFTFPPTPIVFINNDATLSNGIDDGTDSITLTFLTGDVPLRPAPAALTISTSTTKDFTLGRQDFAKGDVLLITDCEEYAIFRKTNCSDTFLVRHSTADDCPSESPPLTTFNSSADLARAYGSPQPARVYGFASSTYRLNGADLMLNTNVIAANIEDLQFEFIEDLNQDGVYDEAWSQTFTNVNDIGFIRVWVLAMSDPVYTYTDTDTYDYPNSPYYSVADNPFASDHGAGGSPASQVGLANDKKHRYRYLASAVIDLRNLRI